MLAILGETSNLISLSNFMHLEMLRLTITLNILKNITYTEVNSFVELFKIYYNRTTKVNMQRVTT